MTDLWFDVAGAGPALVLLHSGLSDSRSWGSVRDKLAESHLVLRYDARGFGSSPDAIAAYDPVDDLASVMTAACTKTAHLIGNSMGAAVARTAAIVQPQLLKSLTLVGPGFPVDQPPSESVVLAARWQAALAASDTEAALAIARTRWIRGADQEARARQTIERQAKSSPFAFIPRDEDYVQRVNRVEQISVPTLVIVGEHDEPLVAAAGHILASRIPSATYVPIPDARHHPHEDQPDRFLEALLAFLRQGRS